MTAVISADGKYRYRLDRTWDEPMRDMGRVCWVMLNPSTADAEQDDPTIRRCIGFSRSWGCSSLTVVNLFGFRSTNPAALWKLTTNEARGQENARHVLEAMREASLVVVAWGAHIAFRSGGNVLYRLPRYNIEAWAAGPIRCLGLTSMGQPRHPLYVKADTRLTPFPTGARK